MTSFNPNLFIHIANILLLVAYSVRDILWLRVFALASSLIAIPYFVLQPLPLWAPLSWTIVFTCVNLLQTVRLLLDRRPVKLTPEEEDVRRLAFRDLPVRKVLQVLSIGCWTSADLGQRILESGKPITSLSLIVHGKVRVTRQERIVGDLVAGNLVGSALLLSGIPAEVDATAIEPVRAVTWEVGVLESYLAANPETRVIMQGHLARDLATKLERLTTEAKGSSA